LTDDILIVQPPHLNTKFENTFEKYDGNYDTDKIKRFLAKRMNGLCGIRTSENAYSFEKPLIVVYFKLDYSRDPKGTNYYRNRVLKVSKEFKRKITFAISNKYDFVDEIETYGLKNEYEKQNNIPLVAAQGSYGEKYHMSQEFSVENLRKFANNLIAGKLKNYMKSEPIPQINKKPVKVLVANNFKSIVDGKDALVEVYAPWCGHCQALEPTYNRLGETMKNEDIVIAKIDGTANDLPPGFASNGYPTIYWKRKDGQPIMYNGGRELNDFISFIAREATEKLKGWKRNGKKRKNKTEL